MKSLSCKVKSDCYLLKLILIFNLIQNLVNYENPQQHFFHGHNFIDHYNLENYPEILNYEGLLENSNSLEEKTLDVGNDISSEDHISKGKNVCLNNVIYHIPFKSKESYHRPVHIFQTEDGKDCPSPSSICHYSKTELKQFWRVVFDVKSEQKLEYGCCPGWKSYSKEHNACTEAICSNACKNGGTCSAPEKCNCFKGWKGILCEIDIDECSENLEGDKPRCHHKCHNTLGSFECDCRRGFKLDKVDNYTCQICLECLPEYRKMTKVLKDHSTQIYKLKKKSATTPKLNITTIVEAVKESMINSKSILEISNKSDDQSIDYYNQESSEFYDQINFTSRKPIGNSSNLKNGKKYDKYKSVLIIIDEGKVRRALERIEFMDQQIGMLEEKLGNCKCGA